jgi:hypothetical protein
MSKASGCVGFVGLSLALAACASSSGDHTVLTQAPICTSPTGLTIEVTNYMQGVGQFSGMPQIRTWSEDADASDLPAALRKTGCFRVIEKTMATSAAREYNRRTDVPDYIATAGTNMSTDFGRQLAGRAGMGLFVNPLPKSVTITLTRVQDETVQTFNADTMTVALAQAVDYLRQQKPSSPGQRGVSQR